MSNSLGCGSSMEWNHLTDYHAHYCKRNQMNEKKNAKVFENYITFDTVQHD